MALVKTFTNNSISRARLYLDHKDASVYTYAAVPVHKGYQLYILISNLWDDKPTVDFLPITNTTTRRRSAAIKICEDDAYRKTTEWASRTKDTVVYVTFEYTKPVVDAAIERQESRTFERELLKLNVG
jgi:hypothetical protein